MSLRKFAPTLSSPLRSCTASSPEEHLPVRDPGLRQPTLAPVVADGAELVARLRAGDEGAYESLFLGHHDALWRFAYGYVRSAEIAEEIVQEVFLALWRDRETWEIDGSVRSWLYGAARNHALNHLRHARVVARFAGRGAAGEQGSDRGEPVVAMGARPTDAHDRVEERELDAAVGRALAALPERRRVAMLLRWKHDLAPGEIAGVLGTTPANVRVLLTRARQELAQLLGRGTPTASL